MDKVNLLEIFLKMKIIDNFDWNGYINFKCYLVDYDRDNIWIVINWDMLKYVNMLLKYFLVFI